MNQLVDHKINDWKETEFGRIPMHWDYKPLENYFDLITYGFTNPMPTTKEGPYMLTAKDIYDGQIQYGSARQTSQEAFDILLTNKSKPKTNDVLITKDGSIGRVAIVEKENMCISQSVALIRTNSKIRPLFLKYLLEAPQYQQLIQRDAGGSTIEHVYITRINKMLVGVPDILTQDLILSVIHNIQLKINLLQRQNKTLEAMAETLFRERFVEKVDEGWELKTISDIIEVRDGTHDSPKQTKTGKHLITSKHLKQSGIDFESAYKISEEDFIEVNKRSKVEINDILFSMIGTLGLIHYVDSEPDYAIKNIGLFKSSKKPEFANFLLLLLKGPIGQKFIHENAVGSTQEYITLGSLRSFEFMYPGEKLLIEFDQEVQPLLKKIRLNNIQIKTLTQLRDTLLPKLMSGEVRVKN